MAWDVTKPANNTKIRNGPGQIRDNFKAIEEADSSLQQYGSNLIDRDTVGAITANPTAIADTMIVYSKQDSSGDPQLYSIDPSANITQLTGNVDSTAAAKGHITLPGNIKLNWGKISSTGNTPKAETFESAYTTAVYSITVTAISDQGSSRGAVVSTGSVTTAGFSIRSTNNGMDVYYLAVGK